MTDHQYDGQGIADALTQAFPVPERQTPTPFRSPLNDVSRAVLQTAAADMGDVPERARIYGLLSTPNPATGRSEFTPAELAMVRGGTGAMFFNVDGTLSEAGRFQLVSILTNRR